MRNPTFCCFLEFGTMRTKMPSADIVRNSFFLLLMLVISSCSKAPGENKSSISVDTANLQRIDSVPQATKAVLKDTVLTITADTVRALYYPNTGREVMTLVKGNKCIITRTGRYDVVDNKGNFWIRVEHMGGRGWIFGGHTSLESDEWVFAEGMTERGHPYAQYGLSRLSGSTFEELWQKIGEAVKKGDYNDEVGTRTATTSDEAITVLEKETIGKNITELFKPGLLLDSVKSINYTNTTEGDEAGRFNHTFVTAIRDGKWRFVLDFVGEMKAMMPVHGHYVLAAEYDLEGVNLGTVGFANIVVWSPKQKKVLNRQRLAYSGVNPMGYPMFSRLEDGSFIASADCSYTNESLPALQIFETYNQALKGSPLKAKAFYITRYFAYNPKTLRFEESKQEVIYRGE
jgi:hypothetical protein